MTLLHFLLLIISILIYRSKSLSWLTYGILITLILSIGINSKVAYDNIDKYPRVVEFDKKVWDASKEKPISMIRYFDGFNCFSKNLVISLLGQSDKLPQKEYPSSYSIKTTQSLFYITDQKWEDKPYYLQLYFNEDSICNFSDLIIVDYPTDDSN